MIRVQFLAGSQKFFSFTPCPDWLWGPPFLLSSGYWGLSLVVKLPRHEADHSLPSSAKVKECVELYLHSHICLHGMVVS
jgi:hypothetical protein